jgi:hypothetical protein
VWGVPPCPIPPCTVRYQPSSSGNILPSSPAVPYHIGRVVHKGFPVSLSTSKSLGNDQARMSSSGFQLPCHHSTSTLGSSHHRFTPRATSYTIYSPQVFIPGEPRYAPRGQDLPQARRILQLGQHNPHPPHTQVTHAALSSQIILVFTTHQ